MRDEKQSRLERETLFMKEVEKRVKAFTDRMIECVKVGIYLI